jgi:hypothetical protein
MVIFLKKYKNNEFESDETLKIKALLNYNEIRSKIADASVDLEYEVAKELFVLESHPNDLYTQN